MHRDNTMPSKLRLAAVFFGIFIEINLMMITIVYTINYYKMSPGPFIFNVLGWSLVLIITGFLLRPVLKSNIVFLFPFLCIMASLMAAVFLNNTLTILAGKEVKNVSVEDFTAYHDAVVIGFKDGKLESGYTGVYVGRMDSRKSASSTFYAMPYVHDNWNKNEPVRVWVLCKYSTAACLANTRTAVVRNIYPGGVKEAEEKFGLKSDPKALTVNWIASPEDEVKKGKSIIIAGISAVNAAWIIVYLASLFSVYRRSKGHTGNHG
jgi:hypothetical protein